MPTAMDKFGNALCMKDLDNHREVATVQDSSSTASASVMSAKLQWAGFQMVDFRETPTEIKIPRMKKNGTE